jgi:hypothetical protein
MIQTNKDILKQLKTTFYDWCSLLTIDEVVSNEDLIKTIERLERMLIAAGA